MANRSTEHDGMARMHRTELKRTHQRTGKSQIKSIIKRRS